MAYSSLADSYRIFSQGRSLGIQQAFRFTVEFKGLDKLDSVVQCNAKEIFPLYVKNVKMPLYSFKKEVFQAGPFDIVFPVFETAGMEVTIEFIEDSVGFISGFLNELASMNFQNGKHLLVPFDIIICTYDNNMNKVTTYTYKRCHYLKCEATSLDYEAVDKVTYNTTFLCNRYSLKVERSIEPPKVTGSRPPKDFDGIRPDDNRSLSRPSGLIPKQLKDPSGNFPLF